jgi:hypothetical protein
MSIKRYISNSATTAAAAAGNSLEHTQGSVSVHFSDAK